MSNNLITSQLQMSELFNFAADELRSFRDAFDMIYNRSFSSRFGGSCIVGQGGDYSTFAAREVDDVKLHQNTFTVDRSVWEIGAMELVANPKMQEKPKSKLPKKHMRKIG